MASGHVSRIKRPNTWLHRPMLQNVKKALANTEPSTHGTKRTSRPGLTMSVHRGRADSSRMAHHFRVWTPKRTWGINFGSHKKAPDNAEAQSCLVREPTFDRIRPWLGKKVYFS
jgi:hypothetical protein